MKSEPNCLQPCGEPEFPADKNTPAVSDWLDEVVEAASNTHGSIDRRLINSLESPIAQPLSGEIGVPNDVGQCGTVGFGGESTAETKMICEVADAATDVVDGGEFSDGILCHRVFGFSSVNSTILLPVLQIPAGHHSPHQD